MISFKVALIKSNTQFILRTFENNECQTEIHNLEDISKKALAAIFFSPSLSDEDLRGIAVELPNLPLRKLSDFGLTENQWVELPQAELEALTKRALAPWLLHNGISVLEELHPVLNHLKALWPNERTAFFEELWSHLKKLWGTQELKIIFNDLADKERPKLVRAMVSGKRVGHPLPASEIEEKIMDHYQGEFSRPFDIIDFQEEKGELVALATIQQSPVIIMAKVFELSRLQKAISQALIEGLA
jgi:hypothetical protein